jgi:hypothetical protein
MDQRIADFISANRGKYTREAIRQQLIDAGHSPEAIDATWAILDTPDPDEAGVAGEGFWGRFFLFVIGLNLAVLLLVALSTGMLARLEGYSVVLIVLAIALAIGALISWAIVAATGPEKLGRTSAMVIGGVVPLLFALLIGGTCYALAGAVSPPAPPAAAGVMTLQIDDPMTFDAEGSATCQPYSDGVGYLIYGENLGMIEGRLVTVSFEFYGALVAPEGAPAPAAEPGAGSQNVNLYVSLQPRGEADAPGDYFIMTGTHVDVDTASDVSSGTVTFAGLGSPVAEPGTMEDRISGSITWTCD